MDTNDVLHELFDRVPGIVAPAVKDLDRRQLSARPDAAANSIGWLVWHLTRVQDDLVADLLGEPQLWEGGEWADGFGLPADPSNTGYGHTPEDVAAVQAESPLVLTGYYAAVAERTTGYLDRLTPAELDRVVDEAWDPPVTVGVRLVSVVSDDLQHAGQANYIRGLLDREGRH